MKHILIDTCSWIDLLNEDDNKLLPHLEFWNNNEHIKIISNKLIIEEWNKNKEKKRKLFLESVSMKVKHANEVIQKEKLSVPKLEPTISNVEHQITTIDNLINGALILEADTEVKALVSDRAIIRKPPFHKKVASHQDAYIIFSTLKHYQALNQEFIFISSNTDEFGSPTNLQTEIHPEIIEDYQDVKISYYNDIGRAIHELKKQLPVELLLSSDEEDLPEEASGDFLFVDKSKHILDQVYDYITIMQNEIAFVPINIFIQNYPFKRKSNSLSYYSVFNAYTDNQEFFELLSNIKITDEKDIEIFEISKFENVIDYHDKLKAILNGLTKNLIFNITNEDTRKRIDVRYNTESPCNCPKCNYNKFKFIDCFNELDSQTTDLKDLIQIGYLNYMIGNYLRSAEIFLRALTVADQSSSKISSFIINYNLDRLSNFIRNHYYGENSQHQFVDELKKNKLSDCFSRLKTKQNEKILEFINNKTFYSNSRDEIQKATSKIIDHYYSSLNGGWSSNSYLGALVNEFASLEEFVNRNHVIYDQYAEFSEIAQTFIEGLFASHAIQDGNDNSRLANFDDWLIFQILNYGKADNINKFYRRYKLKKIKYKKTSTIGDSFEELIDNFFTKNTLLRESFVNNCEENNTPFWSHYNTIFSNIVVLASICDFDKKFYTSFCTKLIDFLKVDTSIRHLNLRHINTFLYRCGEQITSSQLHKIFKNALVDSSYHNSEFFEAISDCFKKRNEKLSLSNLNFKRLLKIAFGECKLCQINHRPSDIIPIYSILKNEFYKQEISNRIKKIIEEKFDVELYYVATVLDIIEFNNTNFKKALELSVPKGSLVSLRGLGKPRDNRFDAVNNVLNLCFKFDIELTKKEIGRIKRLGDYYNWIIDTENFDYKKFKSSWIEEYSTRYYYKRIANSEKVREFLDKEIQNNADNNLVNEYLNLFIRKNWDKND